ncbi:hypothetical protein E2C01_047137 [Portunus trituberculatus]|uniref:Uncharacterized protein n=1 Tax=Portunus trituberculatus TaxID=210409 RepID=A0A5B7G802_PORTR|nr:hypothetical protein [Portunus trituberculatus]
MTCSGAPNHRRAPYLPLPACLYAPQASRGQDQIHRDLNCHPGQVEHKKTIGYDETTDLEGKKEPPASQFSISVPKGEAEV